MKATFWALVIGFFVGLGSQYATASSAITVSGSGGGAISATTGTFTGVVTATSFTGSGTPAFTGPQFIATSSNGVRFTNAGATGIFYGFGETLTDPGAACNTSDTPTGFSSTLSYDGDGRFHVACLDGAPTRLSGVISSNTTAVGNVGASAPDDLQTYTLPASILTHTSRCLRITAMGTTANNANAKTVRLVFGAGPVVIASKQLTASIAGTWVLIGTICRTGASAQRYWGSGENSGGTTVSTTDGTGVWKVPDVTGTATETESSTIVIKTQSTASTSDNDIVSQVLNVEIL